MVNRKRKLLWVIVVVYLTALHLFALLAMVKTDLLIRVVNKLTHRQHLTRANQTTNNLDPWLSNNIYVYSKATHMALKHLFPVGAPYFLGDSITRRLDVATIATNAVNLGISGDSTTGLLNRIGLYDLGNKASIVILAVGINDIRGGKDNKAVDTYRAVVEALPTNMPIVLSAVLPVDETFEEFKGFNKRIQNLNMQIEKLASKRTQTVYINAGPSLADSEGNLRRDLADGDGIHPNAKGLAIWRESLLSAISNLREDKLGNDHAGGVQP